MDSFMTDLDERLTHMHDGIRRAVADLPPEALDWVPGQDMSSIAVLMVHTAGSQRYWVGDVAGEDPAQRDRAAEFEAGGLTVSDLLKLLDDSMAHTRLTLERLSSDQLPELRTSSMHDRSFTVGWALLHALDHTSEHAAQIAMTRQLWEQARSA